MKNRRTVVLVVVALAISASVWLLRQPTPDKTAGSGEVSDSLASPAGVQAPAAMMEGRPKPSNKGKQVDPVQTAIENGSSLAAALKAQSTDGRIESEAQANLAFMAANCHASPNLTPADSDGFEFDDTRAWAIARLIEICAGYDPKQFKVTLNRPNLMASVRTNGWPATETMASETIATSGVAIDVFTAGQLMMENNVFPYDEVLPGMKENYGPEEITKAWLRASTLATCDKVGGCGTNSFEVAVLCAEVGCKENLNLAQALEQRLPASDYRAAMAMYAWLNRRRSGP